MVARLPLIHCEAGRPVAMPHPLHPSVVEARSVELTQTLDAVLDDAGRGSRLLIDFAHIRALIEALPLTSVEFSLAVNRLANARSYAESAEHGACRYELRLLRLSLER
jgi:hypothetical protein